MQTLLRVFYPPQCLTCQELVEVEAALCGACWRDTAFINGATCSKCGVPLPGEIEEDARVTLHCDDCMRVARPWGRGAAAFLYTGNGRRLVMALKHGDRTELAKPAAGWMAQRVPALPADTVIVPVPLHWLRYVKRRYNQAALLARAVARETGCTYLPDALLRPHATKPLDGHTREARFATLQDAIRPHPKRGLALAGRQVLLVDDVMTSGATLAAATEAALQAGADHVDVLVLARVAKDV